MFLAADATLDSGRKQCCVRRTAGEELRNRSQDLPSWHSTVALLFCADQGQGRSLGLRWLGEIPPAQNLRTGSGSSRMGLEIKDGLLAKEDEDLPFPGHIFCSRQLFHFIQDFIFFCFMRTQEVVIGDPESQVIVGTIDVIKSISWTVGMLVCPVQTFNHLFVRAELRGNSIIIGQADNLGDGEPEILTEFMEELLGSQRIGAVTIRNELEMVRKFLPEVPKSHAQGEDAGADTTVIRDLIAEDGFFDSIHDEPYIAFFPADLDIGFVSREDIFRLVVIMVNKWFHTDSSGFAVIGDLLMGDRDVVEIFQGLGSFPEGKLEVHV